MSKKLRVSFFENIKKSSGYFCEIDNVFERAQDTLLK